MTWSISIEICDWKDLVPFGQIGLTGGERGTRTLDLGIMRLTEASLAGFRMI